jgi:G-protein alpha subunit
VNQVYIHNLFVILPLCITSDPRQIDDPQKYSTSVTLACPHCSLGIIHRLPAFPFPQGAVPSFTIYDDILTFSQAFRSERASWRAVVQLNVVRSIRLILDAMSEAQASSLSHSWDSSSASPSTSTNYPTLTPEHLKLKMRLSPLQQVEEILLRRLRPAGSAELEATQLSSARNLPYAGNNSTEVVINSSAPWKNAFSRLLASTTTRSSFESSQDIDFDDPQDPGVVLHACADDMTRLWNDPTVRELLRVRNIRLEDMAGLYAHCFSAGSRTDMLTAFWIHWIG